MRDMATSAQIGPKLGRQRSNPRQGGVLMLAVGFIKA